MKKIILALAIFSLLSVGLDTPLKLKSPSEVIRLGEKFTFDASVIGFTPKTEIYLWTDSLYYLDPSGNSSDSCYHFIFYTKMDSTLPISIIESNMESYARREDLVTLSERQYIREKSKVRYRTINFDVEKGNIYYLEDSTIFLNGKPKIDSSGVTTKSYVGIHDMINIFWYLRLIDIDSMAIGDTFYIWSFAENRRVSYRLPVVVLREETIKVPAGKFDCYVVNCCVRRTKMFSANSGDMAIWISKDDRRIIAQMTRKEKVFGLWQTVIFKLQSLE